MIIERIEIYPDEEGLIFDYYYGPHPLGETRRHLTKIDQLSMATVDLAFKQAHEAALECINENLAEEQTAK